MISKDDALEILDKMEFFQGQRAGRELWFTKPRYIQDEDLRNFCKDVNLLKSYIGDTASMIRCAYCGTSANNATTKKNLYVCCCYMLQYDREANTITQHRRANVEK